MHTISSTIIDTEPTLVSRVKPDPPRTQETYKERPTVMTQRIVVAQDHEFE
ncbi:140_t:CDS:2 [Racocetra fulgida]|uniref:140_t:CDS:1 n=1 Tax=Racocetra fulgida TaxID=60492 RepID=A0A9N8YYZ4_9GLOM|nr:140_t:CDS:2 [Racocetra fulgida]